jgi:hypothetical protein
MENLIKDLSIPANQITQTSNENCFIVIAHRSWLKSLSNGQFAEFFRRQDDPESPALSGSISWCNIHIKVVNKFCFPYRNIISLFIYFRFIRKTHKKSFH